MVYGIIVFQKKGVLCLLFILGLLSILTFFDIAEQNE